MATTKTTQERIKELDMKLEQIKAQKKQLANRAKAEERKARTKRLISIGAEVEHFAGCEIQDLDAFKEYLAKYAYAIANTQKNCGAVAAPNHNE
jgi:hypothetical protein